MSYQTAITIKDAITRIQQQKYVLPSIQREFVWSTDQIEQLFDSLMRSYPISTFLFWKVEKERIDDFQFYSFLKDYHETTDKHNDKADISPTDDITAILDGQQRLTSLYIGLKGTYAKKLPHAHWSNSQAFPKRKLYLNLLSPAADLEMEYDFRFLTKDELIPSDNQHWFEVSKILGFKELGDCLDYAVEEGLTDKSSRSGEQIKFATRTLNNLFNTITQKGTVSYFQEESEELDKVLQIFIRINSGGTKLSYSDLLLSVATAQWKEKDAREVIHQFVDEINSIGEKFAFNKDFVLKSCLVLGDFSDIKFKVDNFTKANMLHIEQEWDAISSAIRVAIELVNRLGFNRDSLTSSNAIIPIAYFILKNNWTSHHIMAGAYESDRRRIYEWLVRVLLKRTFGGTPDNLYPGLRNLIKEHIGQFPLAEIIERSKSTTKPINFTSDDIENLLRIEYSSPLAYSALSLLYPGLKHNYKFQQDHIHPRKYFTEAKLKVEGIVDADIQKTYMNSYNLLPNLQLLQSAENNEKSSKHLDVWLAQQYPTEHSQSLFRQEHSFAPDASLEFDDFISFYEARKEIVRAKLKAALGVD